MGAERIAKPIRSSQPKAPPVVKKSAWGGPAVEIERSIGMVVLDFANPYFSEVARAAEGFAATAGYGLLLTQSSGSPAKERAMLDLLQDGGVAGLLVTPVDGGAEGLGSLLDRGIPMVVVDRHNPEQTTSAVAVDNVLGGRLAGEHLLKQGHRAIALVNGPHSIQVCRERLAGLVEAVELANLDPAEVVTEIMVPSTNEFEGQQVAAHVVASGATAVFCVNDLLAVGLIRELTSHQIDVPGDVAVMGYDDISLAYLMTPSLTTVRQPMEDLGAWAAQQLIVQIEGGHQRQREFAPQLVIRESTAVS